MSLHLFFASTKHLPHLFLASDSFGRRASIAPTTNSLASGIMRGLVLDAGLREWFLVDIYFVTLNYGKLVVCGCEYVDVI